MHSTLPASVQMAFQGQNLPGSLPHVAKATVRMDMHIGLFVEEGMPLFHLVPWE